MPTRMLFRPIAAVCAALAILSLGAPTPAADNQVAPAAVSSLVAPGATVRKLAGGFTFTEGPAADVNGDVYFSDVRNNRIHKWTAADGKVTVHRENTGGANGLMFDRQGRLVACEGRAQRLTLDDMRGATTTLVAEFDGKPLNSPNDLWIDPKGGVYFSDPRYGRARPGAEPQAGQDGMHVYYLAPDGKTLTRATSDLERPNGLIGTPDGKTLYVADHGAGKVWAYDIQSDGALANKRHFADRRCDGMTMDEKGNLYFTDTAVVVYDRTGKQLEEIAIPEQPANATFAGKDGRLLFVTARTSVYGVEMSVRGAYAPAAAK